MFNYQQRNINVKIIFKNQISNIPLVFHLLHHDSLQYIHMLVRHHEIHILHLCYTLISHKDLNFERCVNDNINNLNL